jgi:hypothetical protein
MALGIMAAHFWQVESGIASLKQPRFTAFVNPLRPSSGLTNLHVDGRPLPDFNSLCVELGDVEPHDAASIIEHYVRGGDLVAAYADRPARGMRAEIYWRAASHELAGAIAAVELLASVQTSLLDSCPRLLTRSTVTADQVLQLSDVERGGFKPVAPNPRDDVSNVPSDQPDCYLFHLVAADYSYLEMVHPSDAQASHSQWPVAAVRPLVKSAPNRFELHHQLFAERLEKGVILRARVLGVLLDRDGDQAAAARHYAAFISERLPLTT